MCLGVSVIKVFIYPYILTLFCLTIHIFTGLCKCRPIFPHVSLIVIWHTQGSLGDFYIKKNIQECSSVMFVHLFSPLSSPPPNCFAIKVLMAMGISRLSPLCCVLRPYRSFSLPRLSPALVQEKERKNNHSDLQRPRLTRSQLNGL